MVRKIIDTYQDHPRVIAIKSPVTHNSKFKIPHATTQDINSLSPDKATGPDSIPVKFIKLSANVIDSHFINRNKDIDLNCYSESAKSAKVRSIFKKMRELKYKVTDLLVSLIHFLQFMRDFIHENLTPFVNSFLSNVISAYRKTQSTNHALIRLIENLKTFLDQIKFVGTVLMDLFKTFNCIPNDLLIIKMHAYGFSSKSLTLFYSYLKSQKQSVNINNTHSVFQVLLSGIPQGSILGPILFTQFILQGQRVRTTQLC